MDWRQTKMTSTVFYILRVQVVNKDNIDRRKIFQMKIHNGALYPAVD